MQQTRHRWPSHPCIQATVLLYKWLCLLHCLKAIFSKDSRGGNFEQFQFNFVNKICCRKFCCVSDRYISRRLIIKFNSLHEYTLAQRSGITNEICCTFFGTKRHGTGSNRSSNWSSYSPNSLRVPTFKFEVKFRLSCKQSNCHDVVITQTGRGIRFTGIRLKINRFVHNTHENCAVLPRCNSNGIKNRVIARSALYAFTLLYGKCIISATVLSALANFKLIEPPKTEYGPNWSLIRRLLNCEVGRFVVQKSAL